MNNTPQAIDLPTSKSLINRLLIINALMNNWDKLDELNNGNDDVVAMLTALQQLHKHDECTINIGHGGSCMRFLTAYICTQTNKKITLTGSERMLQRPIQPLVDALRKLDATITYTHENGFAPLYIEGTTLTATHTIVIDASISSQYITALLLIAPYITHGLQLRLMGKVVSNAYIQQTISVMQHYGAAVTMNDKSITVHPIPYAQPAASIAIEADWSSAAFWYNYVAISKTNIVLKLNKLKTNTTQGDEACMHLYAKLGVQSMVVDDGIVISKIEHFSLPTTFNIDLTNNPDLTQPLAISLAMLGIQSTLTGLQTLTIKETNRIVALVTELAKFNVLCTTNYIDNLIINATPTISYNKAPIATYNDHRMAMCFAPCVQLFPTLIIENKDVVSKSYRNFWDNLR
ncbi:MAG: 3-phosphoshikimate 1-carboxyvinyltransferase [Bacteroidia bacterium]|nr:3-phosphoshikimate 1-carboxyvinyltransferase [Bacteroidia bacterium]